MDPGPNRNVRDTGLFDQVGERGLGGQIWSDPMWRRTMRSGRD